MKECVYIQTRSGADLLNFSHFQSKTRTTKLLVREIPFADDSELLARGVLEMHFFLDRFAKAAALFNLKINSKKTECLYQPIKILQS